MLQHHLAEVASESVYLTKDSLSALVQGYYSHMEDVTTRLQEEQSSTRQSVRGEVEGSTHTHAHYAVHNIFQLVLFSVGLHTQNFTEVVRYKSCQKQKRDSVIQVQVLYLVKCLKEV